MEDRWLSEECERLERRARERLRRIETREKELNGRPIDELLDDLLGIGMNVGNGDVGEEEQISILAIKRVITNRVCGL